MNPGRPNVQELPVLLRGESLTLRSWLAPGEGRRLWLCVGTILLGTGLFGLALGSWRAPLQAWYCGIKLPSLLLLTALGNGLLNGMLAPLLGVNLSIRQSLLAVLMSFTIAAMTLGAFSPLLGFLVVNTPRPAPDSPLEVSGHAVLLVSQTLMIALAGVAANVRLLQLLEDMSGGRRSARKVLYAWLVGNLALGSQLAWIMRPFVGTPGLPIEFVRADALNGSFFESLWRALLHLIAL